MSAFMTSDEFAENWLGKEPSILPELGEWATKNKPPRCKTADLGSAALAKTGWVLVFSLYEYHV
jgi:hypothetical protein